MDWKPILWISLALIAFALLVWARIRRSSNRQKQLDQEFDSNFNEFENLLTKAESGDDTAIETLVARNEQRRYSEVWWPNSYNGPLRELGDRVNGILGRHQLGKDIEAAITETQPLFDKLAEAEGTEAEYKALLDLVLALRSYAAHGSYLNVGVGVITHFTHVFHTRIDTRADQIIMKRFNELIADTPGLKNDPKRFAQVFELVRMVERNKKNDSSHPFYPIKLHQLARGRIPWNELVIHHMPSVARAEDLTYEWELPLKINRIQAQWYASKALASNDDTKIGMARILLIELGWFNELANDLAMAEHRLRALPGK